MPINPNIITMIRRNSLRAFRTLSKGKGVSVCIFYPAISGQTEIVKRNIYHDIIEETGPGKVDGIQTYIYIDMNPPLSVVKELGWIKEDMSLPILGYMPYENHWTPEEGALIVVGNEEGYMSGTYEINKVTMYGQGESCLWICNLSPKRT